MRVCTWSMCTGRARSGRADRKLRAMHAWLCRQGRGHTCGSVPGLEEVGDKVDRGVDRLARALVPRRVYCDGRAWVLCARSGVCGGAFVLILRGGWEKRAGLGRRSHLELKRGLHHKLNGVGLLFVERRWQSYDEW